MRKFQRRRIPLETPPGHWLFVLEGGQPGQPQVLFLHGAAGCSGNWIYQLRGLSGHFHVFAPDLRGHGQSPWPGPSYLDDFYADVRALVDRLELGDRFVIACHSFGAAVACRLAHELPTRVAGLALFNTAGHLPSGLVYRSMLLFSGLADQFRRHYPWMVSTNSHVSQWVLKHPVREWDCWKLFPELEMPSLAVLGGHDLLIPARLGKRMAQTLPDCELKFVPGGGHVLMVEQPFESTRWLLGLLKRAFARKSSVDS